MKLSERDRAILDFERSWWTVPGSKERAIRAQLSLSSTRYYSLLRNLIQSPEADAYDPLVVRRLRRLQVHRRRRQFEGRVVPRRPMGERRPTGERP